MNKYKLIDIKFIDLYHFQVWEGKFKDLEQEKYQNKEVYVYANISNLDTKTFEESDVRIYAHSFEELYCPEDYELYELERYGETKEMKREILDAIESKQ